MNCTLNRVGHNYGIMSIFVWNLHDLAFVSLEIRTSFFLFSSTADYGREARNIGQDGIFVIHPWTLFNNSNEKRAWPQKAADFGIPFLAAICLVIMRDGSAEVH